jgi:hypothetical protein
MLFNIHPYTGYSCRHLPHDTPQNQIAQETREAKHNAD